MIIDIPISQAPQSGRQILVGYWWQGRPIYRIAHWNNSCWCIAGTNQRIEPTWFCYLYEFSIPIEGPHSGAGRRDL